jgi:hypothetical protein
LFSKFLAIKPFDPSSIFTPFFFMLTYLICESCISDMRFSHGYAYKSIPLKYSIK